MTRNLTFSLSLWLERLSGLRKNESLKFLINTGKSHISRHFLVWDILRNQKLGTLPVCILNINFYRQNGWKWKQKHFFEQYYSNILYVFSNKCQKLTNLKPYKKPTQKFVFQICNHHRSKWPSFSEKWTPIVLSESNV